MARMETAAIKISKEFGVRFLEDKRCEEGHKKLLHFIPRSNSAELIAMEICECQLQALKEMIGEFETWIKTGKLPPSPDKPYGEKSPPGYIQ